MINRRIRLWHNQRERLQRYRQSKNISTGEDRAIPTGICKSLKDGYMAKRSSEVGDDETGISNRSTRNDRRLFRNELHIVLTTVFPDPHSPREYLWCSYGTQGFYNNSQVADVREVRLNRGGMYCPDLRRPKVRREVPNNFPLSQSWISSNGKPLSCSIENLRPGRFREERPCWKYSIIYRSTIPLRKSYPCNLTPFNIWFLCIINERSLSIHYGNMFWYTLHEQYIGWLARD